MIILRKWKTYDKDILESKLEGLYSLPVGTVDEMMKAALENPGLMVHVFSTICTEPLIKYEDGKWFLLF
jgi:hypothetical protein